MVIALQTRRTIPTLETLAQEPEVPTHISPSGWGKRKYWRLAIQCPHCGDLHTHGGGGVEDGPPLLGHRVAHCPDGGGKGYTLVAGPPDMPEPKELSRREQRKIWNQYYWSRGDFSTMPKGEMARRERALRAGLIKNLCESVPESAEV